MEPELLMAPTQSTFLMAVLSMSHTMPTTMMDMLLMYLMKELLPILMQFILWLTLLPILLLLDMVSPILDKECNFCNVHFIYLFILNLKQ